MRLPTERKRTKSTRGAFWGPPNNQIGTPWRLCYKSKGYVMKAKSDGRSRRFRAKGKPEIITDAQIEVKKIIITIHEKNGKL